VHAVGGHEVTLYEPHTLLIKNRRCRRFERKVRMKLKLWN
jgi:hypothetical protein